MNQAKNRKLCWNCEGNVHLHAAKCPYCGTDLSAESSRPSEQKEPLSRRPQQRTAEPPPYADLENPSEPPPPPYWQEEEVLWNESRSASSEPIRESGERREILPMLLLLPGAFFLLFGFILLLFSKDGTLTLEWNAHYAFFYLAFSLPLIFFGWRFLSALSHPHSEKIPVKRSPPDESI